MTQVSLLSFLRRISWLISFLLGAFSALLLSDLSSGSYTTGAENFFEWGWIWGVIFMLLFKKFLLSENIISAISFEPVPLKNDIGVSSPHQNIDVQSFPLIQLSEISDMRGNFKENIQAESKQEIEKKQVTPVIPPPPEVKKPNWIVAFFSDRPLAKIGGIILFLAAFFFLSLVWSIVGSIGKVIIGLIFGFSLYVIGVWMDKKGHITESRTLLGVGIAINTLTILSGRWIIGDTSGSIFSDTLTLIFLILNTLFAVATGLVYNSRTFLIFSFVFAYFIPFIVRSESDSSILIMFYTLTISLGGYLLTWLFLQRNERIDDMKWLFRTIIIGSLMLLGLTGFGVESVMELILISILSSILTTTGIFISRKTELRDESVPSLLISAYIILICSIFGIGDKEQATIIVSFIFTLPILVYTALFMVRVNLVIYTWILLIPLGVALILFGVFGIPSLVLILVPIVLIYGLAGLFLVSFMTEVLRYVFFLVISAFIFICSVAIDGSHYEISLSSRWVISISSLGFFLLSLWSSYKYKLIHLSLIALISSSIIFTTSLIPEWEASWMMYILFLAVTFSYPFFVRKSIKEQFSSFISYQVVANLFMIGELFYLGRNIWFTRDGSSLVTLGIIVFLLSIASLFYSFMLIRVTLSNGSLSSLSSDLKRNATTLLGIPLSLFTLAIAVTFSESPLVVSTAWVVESVVLAYYSSKQRNQGMLIGTIILASIGILRLIPFFDSIYTGEYLALVPITIIALSLYCTLLFIVDREKNPLANVYDFIHIFGISMVAYALMEIIPHTQTGWSLLGLNIFLLLSTWFYTKVSSKIISLWMIFLSLIIYFYHLVRVEELSMNLGPVFIQLTALSIGTFAVWYMKSKNQFGKYAFIYAFIMFLLITSIYVNQLTNNIFAVTIYLTIIATIYLLFGINNNVAKFRTIGLYIGSGVLIKILFYDIWAGVDNLIIRVVALMITGGIMIAISQLYGRRVNRPWNEEFALSNFANNSQSAMIINDEMQGEHPSSPDDMPFDESISNDLKEFDISHISSIELQNLSGEIILLSRRAGIIRVANYIVKHLGKTEFVPNELEAALKNLIPHIQSSLPKKELDTILLKIHNWVLLGGKIVIKEKI
ncbi:MAG: hypothetical protein HHAS10_08310 [Candidatus Altimarinota bacterium]